MSIQDKDYLALTLIGEARGEPIEGIIAVASVIRNRVYSAKSSYQKVCLAPSQFSCWNQSDPNFQLLQKIMNDLDQGNTINDPYLRQCMAVANAIFREDFLDNTKHCQNYVSATRYNLALSRQGDSDKWILNLKVSCRYGHHVFLSE